MAVTGWAVGNRRSAGGNLSATDGLQLRVAADFRLAGNFPSEGSTSEFVIQDFC